MNLWKIIAIIVGIIVYSFFAAWLDEYLTKRKLKQDEKEKP